MKYKNRKFILNDILQIENDKTEFDRCYFTGEFSIELINSDATFKNCTFEKISIEAINIENSKCGLLGCKFSKNGSIDNFVSQIVSEHSNLYMNNCYFENNLSPVLEVRSSTLEMKNCRIENNSGYGFSSLNSVIKIENSTFFNNSSKEFESNQIILESSHGSIKNCKIEHCDSGSGIFIRADSDIEIKNCKIENNLGGIYIEDNSSVEIISCKITNNRDENDEFLQLFLDSSNAYIIQTTIEKGTCGVYSQKGGIINLNNCTISNNKKGICLFEYSILKLINSKIKDNEHTPQIYSEESKVFIEGCDIVSSSGNLIELIKPLDFDLKDSKIDISRIKLDR